MPMMKSHPSDVALDDDLREWLAVALHRLTGAEEFQSKALKVEASFRHFYRISSARSREKTFVMMSSPPEREHNDRFLYLADVFHRAHIGVAEILAHDSTHGWFLMSDLGEQDLESAYSGADKNRAVAAAIATLIRIQSINDAGITAYTAERLTMELGIFREWFLGDLLATTLPPALEDALSQLVLRARAQPQCCVHRDYHCRNLLFADSGAFGVVDFQDALLGPASYDLASLLHDCYYTFSEAEISRWRTHYLSLTPLTLDPDAFAQDLDWAAVQRQLKAIGIFVRLNSRDGKPSHLPYIEPVLARLTYICRKYPELSPLGNWLKTKQPETTRALASRNS
jgi:aminoglycoside/choline kinase family phosphotransferase